MAAKVRWKSVLLWLMLLEAILQVTQAQRTCGHRPPKPDEVLHHIHLEPAHLVRKRSIDQQLRIKLVYDQSFYRLPPEKLEVVNKTLPAAIHYWEQTLRVRQSHAPILLSRKCEGSKMFYKKGSSHAYCMNSCEPVTMCGEVRVLEQHLDICRVCNSSGSNCREEPGSAGRGVDEADFVFYVSALQTERCAKGQTIAYAAHCQLEAALDRPIAGHANLCPDAIFTKTQDRETLFSTMKHEILHALGFSVSLFAYYRDKDGNPRTPRTMNGKPYLNETLQNWQWSDQVIRTVTRSQWKVRGGYTTRHIHMMVTPRVVEEARRHFNCRTLEGAELEDQGGEGTELTHWEKRIFENEAMTGIHTQNPVYSRLTLALMEDTGWYEPNFNMSEPLSWGHSMGCNFVTKSCLQWMETHGAKRQNIYPFCDIVKRDPLYTSCSEDRTALTVCNLVEYTEPLPLIYQNFVDLQGVPPYLVGHFGGSLMLADYCPFFQEFHWKSQNVSIRGSKCIYEENSVHPENNLALESYGHKARCFNHAPVPWEERHCHHTRHKQNYGSGCYQFNCSDGRLQVRVLNRVYTCYKEDQVLHVTISTSGRLHEGHIKCPPCREICEADQCLPDSTPPPQPQYMTDALVCRASNSAHLSKGLFVGILILGLLRSKL